MVQREIKILRGETTLRIFDNDSDLMTPFCLRADDPANLAGLGLYGHSRRRHFQRIRQGVSIRISGTDEVFVQIASRRCRWT